MNRKEQKLEELLREARPVVKDDPTFLLETQRRMAAVEGVKYEVDRQRRYGRTVLIVTLVIGIVAGCFAATLAFLYPISITGDGESIWESARIFLDHWKHRLMLPIALCAIALGLVVTKGKKGKAWS